MCIAGVKVKKTKHGTKIGTGQRKPLYVTEERLSCIKDALDFLEACGGNRAAMFLALPEKTRLDYLYSNWTYQDPLAKLSI